MRIIAREAIENRTEGVAEQKFVVLCNVAMAGDTDHERERDGPSVLAA
jgi:hypothetical protein